MKTKEELDFITCAVGAGCLLSFIYIISLLVAIKAGYIWVALIFTSLGAIMGFIACAILTMER